MVCAENLLDAIKYWIHVEDMPDKIPSNYSLETTRLPNKILAIIINELSSDEERNLATLASCRLASHVLCSLATPLFFSSIHLDVGWLDNNAEIIANFQEGADKLHQILNIHDIAALVQTLRLKCYKENLKNETNGNLVFEILHRLPRFAWKFWTSLNFLQLQGVLDRLCKLCADLQILRRWIFAMLKVFLSQPSLHLPVCDVFVFGILHFL